MQTGWRLTKLLDALGSKTGQELEVVPSVQPVLVVGEARGLTAPLRGNRVQAGAFIFPAVAEHACIKIQGVAAGGCLIRFLSVSALVGTTFRWRTTPDEQFTSMSVSATLLPMQDAVASTRILAGAGLAAELPPGVSQTFLSPANENIGLPHPPFEIDLPNSWWLTLWTINDNIAITYETVCEDVEVQTAAL